jgi:VCBS repeat-containing protein
MFTTLTAPGAYFTEAYAINNRGEVTGNYLVSGGVYGFVYDNGTLTTLTTFGSTFATWARAINNSGEVAGFYYDSSGTHGFLATQPNVGTPNNPPPQSVTVAEGQTTTNLYSMLVDDVDAANPGAQVSITSIGLSNTMGFAYLDTTDGLLTYTADGFQPSVTQPQDSFTYTASDGAIGTVNVTVTGANQRTQVGTSGNDTLTANGSGQRLVGGNGDDTLTGHGSGQLLFGGDGNDTITADGAKSTIWGGTGTNTITLKGAQERVVLQQGGTDNISGFNLHNDVLDLRQVLAEALKSFSVSDFQVTSSGNDATLSYVGTPAFTGGSPLAVLHEVGSGVTLNTLISDHALVT